RNTFPQIIRIGSRHPMLTSTTASILNQNSMPRGIPNRFLPHESDSSEQSDRQVTGLRVLVVEDENLVALLLEDMLAELGHTIVGPVARVKKALDIIQREEIDLAILDVNINGEETYPIADVLAARGVPFFFSTGYDKKSLRAPHQDRPTLQKPFQRQDLEKLFAEILHRDVWHPTRNMN
ncbi:MAG TPA: response regulator, partial [Pseudolabrys sp.]